MVRRPASVFVLVLAATASAQPQPNPEGAKLFEEGRALAKDGKYEQACAKFEQSLAIDPAIGTQLNFGDCHEKLGHNAQAWRIFDAASEAEKTSNPERSKYSRSRADALLPKVGTVVLQVGSPDMPMIDVSVAGRSLKPAPVITEIVDPGDIEIKVSAPNAPTFQQVAKVAAGMTVTTVVPPLDASTPEVSPGPGDDPARRRRSRLILAYGVGGVGGVALITGVVLGVKARGDYNAQVDNGNCNPGCNDVGFAAQEDAISLANVGTVFGVGGLVLLGAGAALFLTAPKDVVVTPTATASSAGISVVGRF